jgi:hypothetical protein
MASGSVFTKNGFNAMLNRAFKASPTNTATTRFGIGTGSTTPAVTDTALATAITGWASGPSDYKNYVSGYPTFDTTNQKVTVQAFISSTEANGNTITEIGDFNTDGTPVMSSRTVFSTGIVKNSAVQVYVTTTFKRS